MPTKDFLENAKPVQGDFLANATPVDEAPGVPKAPDAVMSAKPMGLTDVDPHAMPHSMADVGKEGLTVLSNIGAGGLGALATVGRLTAVPDLLMGKPTIYQDAFNAAKHPWNAMQSMGHAAQERPLETLEQTIGGAGAGAALGELGGMTAKATDALSNPIPRSYRSPAIPLEEAQARTMTDALGVNPRAYRSTVQTLTQHGPVVKDYIQRNNFGTKPLEFSKAASGAGQEATGHFQQNFIQPNEMAETAEGPLGDVYRRVTQINKELNPAHRNQLTLQTDAQMARNAELAAERDRLNNAMYETLSYRSGMPVEDIRALNQRGASLQSVGEEADAAQQLRRLGYGAYNAQGQPLPLGPMDKALKLLKVLRGGEEAVAGRKIGRVFNGMTAEPTPLPDANRINMFRHAAEQEELGNMQQQMAKADANYATRGTRLQRMQKGAQ